MISPADTTWRELLARHAPAVHALVEQELQDFADVAQREAEDLPSAFAGEDDVVARGILACGKAEVVPLVELMHPMLRRALGAVSDNDRRNSLAAKRILSFALLAEGVGTKTPSGLDATPLKSLAAGRKSLSDTEQRSAALLALAFGDPDTARALIDAEPVSYEQPVVRFEFNLYELIRYLAHVIEHRRPADWIEPAWGEYLAGFPMHLAADAAEWPDIFYFARVLANARGDRVGDMADDLHARVRLLASGGQ
ncbi:hypothetical protein H4CHR_00496 [Variovorax sp. PBS-H4]|uniref:hypothetical protein n=1 Tax=Variovorax sp. PBS-H4 TaxID=434008 RepID=UPI0013197537|nr:hypothetical protein [Variovorax sp. PBS-H4]VTU19994.1 hypothetical protein H4CHR_00496 [Variovorax sp. PBS-H4]